jgi:hypothetical protein
MATAFEEFRKCQAAVVISTKAEGHLSVISTGGRRPEWRDLAAHERHVRFEARCLDSAALQSRDILLFQQAFLVAAGGRPALQRRNILLFWQAFLVAAAGRAALRSTWQGKGCGSLDMTSPGVQRLCKPRTADG